jgi:hypothetical protein
MMDIIKDANHKVDLLMHKVEHHQPVVEDNVNTNTKPVTYQSARVSRAKAMRDSFEQIKKLEKEFEEAQNARSSISFSSEA